MSKTISFVTVKIPSLYVCSYTVGIAVSWLGHKKIGEGLTATVLLN